MVLAKRACFLTALLLLVCARSGRADGLFNTLTDTTSGSDAAGVGPLADSFSTGSSSFQFDSLTVLLSNQLLNPTISTLLGISPCSGATCGTTTLLLLNNSTTCAGSPSCPGTAIETIGSLNNSILSSTPGDFTFSTSVDLQPDTRYWIELTSTDNNSFWAFTGVVSGGEFFSNPGGVASDVNGPYQMEVAGASLGSGAVPEPSALSLLFAGIAVIGFVAAIRRKARVYAQPL